MSGYFCYDCQGYFTAFDMHKINSEYTKRGRCRECHRAYTRNYHLRKKAALSPQNFMECDDCDRIFSKYQEGKPKNGEIRKLMIECRFCKSEEIDSYKAENKNDR
jgi:hypothetical protein